MSAKRKLLSLFSGCGGMDLGFTGAFSCSERSVNIKMHPDWVAFSILGHHVGKHEGVRFS